MAKFTGVELVEYQIIARCNVAKATGHETSGLFVHRLTRYSADIYSKAVLLHT